MPCWNTTRIAAPWLGLACCLLTANVQAQVSPPGGEDLYRQTADDAHRKSASCVKCHTGVHDMHAKPTVKLGCIDCHGGDANCDNKEGAHVRPKFPEMWPTSANPVRSYTLLNHESPEFVRFVNPGDLRVAHISCGSCHPQEVLQVRKSMMTHGCMLWGAALYNNGAVPHKASRYGESYTMHGTPQRMQNVWKPEEVPQIARDLREKAMVLYLDPLPRFEISQPGNILRVFEQGGRFRPEVGIPELGEEPGRPRTRLSTRGLGTENRTDPVFIGLQKTRLLDPTLNFLGTNDHSGDYRSSGCSGCHVVYANDRSPVHSGPYARFGKSAFAAPEPDLNGPNQFVTNVDPTIPKDERGHPIAHRFTTAVATSQCIVCHIHPGTNVLNTYIGFMWWDNESDGELMYPREQKNPTSEELAQSQMSNPDETAARGNWSDPNFLERVAELNQIARHNQFADFNGHGWVFRAVFKKDRQGRLLDPFGKPVENLTTEKLRAAVVQPEEQYVPPIITPEPQQVWPDPARQQTLASSKSCADMPVHLMDIHQEKGMHCVDCHFVQDAHGNTKLYGEVRAAIEITCIDCHGPADKTVMQRLHEGKGMRTSGPAAEPASAKNPRGGRDLMALRTPDGRPRFEVRPVTRPDGRRELALIQRAMVEAGREWEVKQTADTTNPTSYNYNQKSHMAKTVRWSELDGKLTWGGVVQELVDANGKKVEVVDQKPCAHQSGNMSCMTCHSSWNPSCFGCHLPQKANKKAPALHNEGDVSRNLVAYNFQTLRDDVYMLARDGLATGNKINPARSSCAIHVTSYNGNRESIYHQQQTISGSGMSGIAFSTNVPHTVRGAHPNLRGVVPAGASETKMCTDCHVSVNNDNNAIMAQLLMQGTNYTNFMGRYCWIAAGEHGLEAAVVTEQNEPQAVIGSSLHRIAFPDHFKKHVEHDLELEHAHEHPGLDVLEQLRRPMRKPEVLMVQPRGEYLYAACGPDGFRAFDIAFIDDKAFSERITTAPVSPLGQRLHVPTKYATAIAAPSTLAPDPTRVQPPENHEQPVHPLYAYIYVTDKYEGLILVGAGTLLDGNPLNNFLERAVTFNPDGILCGARNITIVGHYAYICCDAGLVVVTLEDPKTPKVTAVIGHETLEHPVAVQVQFRYAFVCDEHKGLHIFDVTNLHTPVHKGLLHMEECKNVYVARTYAYVAAGKHGLHVVDVTRPEQPVLDQVFDAGGCLNEVHDVKLGITYTSEFAYLADGQNGLRVVQLTSPDTPGNAGFSPRPTPQLVATYKLPKGGHALAIGEALDRDRAVDESGSQIAVFGRVGARPLNWEEQTRMHRRLGPLHPTRAGEVWQVSDDPLDTRIYNFPPALGQVRMAMPLLGPWPQRR
ncbi:LVIVD repeat protein [Anatilimnocola aggregata]|uniref:LVIVD repeat protein n=1 Tax=Anatilimnocola aggregata TaxID=2528021 RepID=A0A517YEB2_9BACT|nr:hypothetical protein [Anatilimnocola aggregata]QDU28570.1 LVIVD repeat protein [Anatilimnocola aggregata]